MIKNIILDLGGVIIDLDPEATARSFGQLGLEDFRRQYSQAKQTGIFDLYDKGLVSDEEFRNALRGFAPYALTDEQIDAAWNAMLLSVPVHRLEFLLGLKSRFRTFLLSNTNHIHVRAFSKELFRMHAINDFTDYFEKCYYSCDIGMRKPDAEIFEFVLSQNGLKAEETLFVDDSIQHVEGAKAVGIAGILLPKNMEVADLLRGMI